MEPAWTSPRILVLGLLLALSLSACSSLSTPVLRHETGEAIGKGRVRLRGMLETSRLHPAFPSPGAFDGVTQTSSVLTGGIFGVKGTYGVTPKMDLSLSTFLGAHSTGFKIQGKYQPIKMGKFALAGMIGVGRFSANTDVTYLSTAGETTVQHNLSASQWEFSAPVSFAFTPQNVVYSGLTLYTTQVTGTANASSVELSHTDLAVNLGYRFMLGVLEFDAEAAIAKVTDPFSSQSQMTPYFGVSGGITF